MADDLEARFRVRLEGKEELADFFRKSQGEAQAFGANLSKAMAGAGSAISGFASRASASLSAFAGGSFSAGFAANAKGVLQFRDAVTQLAVSANLGKDKIGGLKDEIQAVARASNQMQGDVTESLQAFVEKTGDIETARKNLELYGKVATATGAQMADVARVGVELSAKLGISSQGNAFAILAAQSKAGAVELRDLATKAPRIFAAAAGFGVKGEEGLRGTGALAQVFAKGFGGTGTSANVATAVENTFNDILKVQGKLEANGIKVKGRDPYEVIKDIIRKTGGDREQLLKHGGGGVFDVRAMRGIEVLAREFRETGGFATFDAFKNIKGADISGDFALRAGTGAGRLKAAEQAYQAFNDRYLGGIAEFAANHVTGISLGVNTLGGLGKGLSFAGGLLGRAAGASGVGGPLATLGASRVFVVNWPAGGLGGGLPGAGSDGMGLLGKAGMVAMAGAAGYAVGTVLDQKLGLSDRLSGWAFEKFHPGARGDGPTTRQPRAVVPALPAADAPEASSVHIGSLEVSIVGDEAEVKVNGTRSVKTTARRSTYGGN